MIVRYLIKINYVGTLYRGSQKLIEFPNGTVQDVIEKALQTLHTSDIPCTTFASRTDKGVHALMNTLHVDLEHKTPGEVFQPHFITKSLNLYLRKNDHEIVVMKTSVVPDVFHARRSAKWRSYIYRLAVIKPEVDANYLKRNSCEEFLPVTEVNRCHIVPSNLDFQKVTAAIRLFEGAHDFTTFTKNLLRMPWKNPCRVIEAFKFYPLTNSNFVNDPQYINISLWEFYIKSTSFLHHQIRKLVGTALSVGFGNISLSDVEFMLKEPDPDNWKKCKLVPSGGLYLSNIHYNETDFFLGPTSKPPCEVAEDTRKL